MPSSQRRIVKMAGSPEFELGTGMGEYDKAQQHNLLFGWWSIASILFFNWFALISNSRAAGQLRKIARKT